MKTAILILLQLAASGSDAYYTDRNLSRNPNLYNSREANPIARPFVQTRAGRIGYFATTAGIQIALPQIIKKKHPKLATALAIADIADNAQGAAFSGKQ